MYQVSDDEVLLLWQAVRRLQPDPAEKKDQPSSARGHPVRGDCPAMTAAPNGTDLDPMTGWLTRGTAGEIERRTDRPGVQQLLKTVSPVPEPGFG